MDQFIADKKILTVFELPDQKTPAGEMMVEITYDNAKEKVRSYGYYGSIRFNKS